MCQQRAEVCVCPHPNNPMATPPLVSQFQTPSYTLPPYLTCPMAVQYLHLTANHMTAYPLEIRLMASSVWTNLHLLFSLHFLRLHLVVPPPAMCQGAPPQPMIVVEKGLKNTLKVTLLRRTHLQFH